MTKQEQREIIDALTPLWVQLAQKADQMGVNLTMCIRRNNEGYTIQNMFCENTDVTIVNHIMTIRYPSQENPFWGDEEETTSLPAASEK